MDNSSFSQESLPGSELNQQRSRLTEEALREHNMNCEAQDLSKKISAIIDNGGISVQHKRKNYANTLILLGDRLCSRKTFSRTADGIINSIADTLANKLQDLTHKTETLDEFERTSCRYLSTHTSNREKLSLGNKALDTIVERTHRLLSRQHEFGAGPSHGR